MTTISELSRTYSLMMDEKGRANRAEEKLIATEDKLRRAVDALALVCSRPATDVNYKKPWANNQRWLSLNIRAEDWEFVQATLVILRRTL